MRLGRWSRRRWSSAVRDVPHPAPLDELRKLLRELSPDQVTIAGFLVSPDVWTALEETVPRAEDVGSSPLLGLTVRRVPLLPPATIIPIDRAGKPLLKPRGAGPRPTTIQEEDDGKRDDG